MTNTRPEAQEMLPCKHEAFEGRCVHCNAPFINGQPAASPGVRVPEGWRLVPYIPEIEQRHAMQRTWEQGKTLWFQLYQAALDAAPSSQGNGDGGTGEQVCGACGQPWTGEKCGQAENGHPFPTCYPTAPHPRNGETASETPVEQEIWSAFYSKPSNCNGCGKPLVVENAWMFDGCPCNSPAGVNDKNLYRWKLLSELQQSDARRAEDFERRFRELERGFKESILQRSEAIRASAGRAG